MKRKLFLGLLASAAVSFTACQKDEVISQIPQDNAIGFGTYVGRDAQTKASVSTLETMKNDNKGFGVYAYYTGGTNWESAMNTATPTFFTNQQVKWSTSIAPAGWDYETKKYWPGESNNYKISFFAYAPYEEETDNTGDLITTLSSSSTTGDPSIKYTVPETVSNQIDLLVADPVTDTYYKDDNGGTVSFTFNHVLSRIGFKVKTARDDYKITIKEITVSGKFYTSGTLNLNSGEWTNQSVAKNNSETEIATDYTVSEFNNKATNLRNTNGLDITKDGHYIMVIPTTLNTDDKNVSVTVIYNYAYKVSNDTYAAEVENTTATGSVKVNFEKGNAYNLVMTLDPLKPIIFDVTSVSEWTPTNGTDVTVQ